jgi:hypothetical protein
MRRRLRIIYGSQSGRQQQQEEKNSHCKAAVTSSSPTQYSEFDGVPSYVPPTVIIGTVVPSGSYYRFYYV